MLIAEASAAFAPIGSHAQQRHLNSPAYEELKLLLLHRARSQKGYYIALSHGESNCMKWLSEISITKAL